MPASPAPVVPALPGAEIDLPPDLGRLQELAYNLWWTWSPEARQLFSAIDGGAWARYRNPVELLLSVDHPHWEALLENDTFTDAYTAVLRRFDAYTKGTDSSWFRRRHPGYDQGPFAYFSMEYGIHPCLAIYSGGLGVLSGDHCKSASDLGLPLVAVGLLYRFGYFRQTVDADGLQQHTYREYDFSRLPLRPAARPSGGELVVRVPFPGREVAAKVWLAQVGRVPLLLLDTDVSHNDPADRPITLILYVRGREMRLAQELVLGVGGARALAALGIEPAVWHINEGHCALLQLERLRRGAAAASFEEAWEGIRRRVLFTTHTPVPAGHESFDRSLMGSYLEPWSEALGVEVGRLLTLGHADHGEAGQPFNLTALGMRTSPIANAVSRINARVCDRMWRHLLPAADPGVPAVRAVTNGVHLPTWLGVEMRDLLERYLGPAWGEGDGREVEAGVQEIPDGELWAAHGAQKERLGRFVRSRVRQQAARHGAPPGELREVARLFDPAALTVGFARRFATYKRADLIFSDLHRLRGLLGHPDRPVQILFAGKAHPADRPGQELIQHIFQLSREEGFRGRVFFLEDYDLRVARMMVRGVDLWLNTPRQPLEASGTSGQKAAVNGVLNCSILDGWWPEAYDGRNGWAIGTAEPPEEPWLGDQEDARSLYRILEEEVVPTFYDRDAEGLPRRWLAMMKRSIATIGPRFSSSRMVRGYTDLYLEAARETAGVEG